MKHPGVQKIIDVLKNIDNSVESQMGFDMCGWYPHRKLTNHPCGTACCIAGWAQAQFENPEIISPIQALEDFCNLEDASIRNLWELVSPSDLKLKWLTLPMAIKVLEIFRDTGEVKWDEVYHSMV